MQYPLVVCGDVSVDPGVSGPPALTTAPDAPADHATQLASTHQGASRTGVSMKTRLTGYRIRHNAYDDKVWDDDKWDDNVWEDNI